MSIDIADLAACRMLALGEPTHWEPAFQQARNELFAQLVERGFSSIALETDRIAALSVDDFVRHGIGEFDAVMREGFTHGFGEFAGNRQLVAWMREYNDGRPDEQRLRFYGCDTQTENTTAPSPRGYLEYARDYLKLDVDLAGDDAPWVREEAILDAAKSPGNSDEARRLRAIADDMLVTLDAQVPGSREEREDWLRARTYLTAGIGLLRYHRQAAKPMDRPSRIAGLLAVRDAIIAQNLLDIRDIEAQRRPTLVSAHNVHLQPSHPSNTPIGDGAVTWIAAGQVVAALLHEQYVFIVGGLVPGAPGWSLSTDVSAVLTPEGAALPHGYVPVTPGVVDGAVAALCVSAG
jgi:erythromycin esterase-like protein